jgi:hypothetical protein
MMPRNKRSLFRFVGLLGLLSLAWLGNRAGHSMARAGWFQSAIVPAKDTGTGLSPSDRPQSAPVSTNQSASALKRLRAIVAASPNLANDWEARAQIDDILAKLSANELAAIYAELDIGLDSDSRFLAQKVGVAWARKDPSAALAAAQAKRSLLGSSLAAGIFNDWAADEPSAALAWLNSPDLPAGLEEMKAKLRGGALFDLVGRDFDLATSEFLKLDQNRNDGWDSRGVLGSWASAYADDPVMRERLVEFAKSTGRPDDYAELNSSLLRAWPQKDAEAMRVYLEGLRAYLNSDAVPVEARPNVDATAVGAAIYRELHRPGSGMVDGTLFSEP